MDRELLKLMIVGVVSIIGALATVIVQLRSVSARYSEEHARNRERLDKIIILVNGRYSAVVKELDDLRRNIDARRILDAKMGDSE